ncbi:MAG: helix-turn-helix domain-containing protein [Chloroflexota bacterium]|nr:helix-turn-helix domain-containing protein [Chloroflexota bacterium]
MTPVRSTAPSRTSETGGGTAAPREGSGDRWLSINAACAYLGVDQSTLRRWSDAGKVPVFRTPGGHRRYAEGDLRALVGDAPRRQERPRVSQRALTDRSLSAYEDDYLRGARERRWYRAFGTATQEEHRRLGRRLVDLAVRFAAVAPTVGDRASLLIEGRQIGEHYGRSGATLGLSPSETVEAFLYFRHPVVRAVTELIEEEELAVRRAVRLFAEINHFMDQVLLATVEAHEAHAEAARSRPLESVGEPGAGNGLGSLLGAR